MEEKKSLLDDEGYNKAGLEFDQEVVSAMEDNLVITSEEMEKIEKLRSKACVKCQKCCSLSLLPVDFKDEREFSFYEVKGFKMFIMGGRMYTIIHKKCQHLTPLGCKIYNKRPDACKYYDGRLDPVVTKACLWHQIKEDPENKRPKILAMEDAPRKTLQTVKKEGG
jgi:Fe-S-cluster containining protein